MGEKQMVRQGMALLLCLLLCAGLCACQEEQPGKIDNLFSFILAEEEGKLLPRRGEILSPMEDVLKANGWTEKDLEEDPLGDGQILTVPLEVEGLPEVTEQPVSYTHLDVYKRQAVESLGSGWWMNRLCPS